MAGHSNSSELSPSIDLSTDLNIMQQGKKQKRNRRTVGEFVEKSFRDFEINYGSVTSRGDNGNFTTGRFFSFLGLIDSDKVETNEDSVSKPDSTEKEGRSFWAYATVLTILMTLVTSLYLPALALLCVRRTVFVTSGSLIRTLLLVGRFCTLALLVILPVPSSENSETDSANQVSSNNNRSHGKLIGYLFQDRADTPKWIQNCVSIIEGNAVASTNNGKGDSRAWPPPALTALAVITLVAFIVHPDGPTWMLLGKLRDGLQWLWQVCINFFDMLRNCKIPNSILACTSIASLILLISIIYRIVRMKDNDTKPSQQAEKVRHKHKKNKKGRGSGNRQNYNNSGGKAKLKNNHIRPNKESLNPPMSRSRSSSTSSREPGEDSIGILVKKTTLSSPTTEACSDQQISADLSKHENSGESQSNSNSKIAQIKLKKNDTVSTISEYSVYVDDDKSSSSSLHSLSSSNSHNQFKRHLSGNQNTTSNIHKNFTGSRSENSRRQRGKRGPRKTNSQIHNQKSSSYLHYHPPSPKQSSAQALSSMPTSPSSLQRRFDSHHPSNKSKRQNNRYKNSKRGGFSETSNHEIRQQPSNRFRHTNDSLSGQNQLSPCSPLDLNMNKCNNKFTSSHNKNKLKPSFTTSLVPVSKEESNRLTVYPSSPSQPNYKKEIHSSSRNVESSFAHPNESSSSSIISNLDNTVTLNQIGSVSSTHFDRTNAQLQNLKSALNYNVPNYANSYSFSHGYHGRYSPGKMELAGFLAQVGLVGSSCAGILADLDDVDALERLSNAQFLGYNIDFEKRRHIIALLQARRRRNTVGKLNGNSWMSADLKSVTPVRPPPGLELDNEILLKSVRKGDNSNGSDNLECQLQSIPVQERTAFCEKMPSYNDVPNNIKNQSLGFGLPFYNNQGYGFQTNGQEGGVGVSSNITQYRNRGDISSNVVKSQSSSMNIFNEDEIEADMQELGGQMAVSILDF